MIWKGAGGSNLAGDKTLRHLICCVLFASGLSACSAVGVIESSDPKVKFEQAAELLYQQNRPGPAERLIREALEIYERRKDEAGMAEAYRRYAFFFVAPAVQKSAEIYTQAGFLDGTSYANRFLRSAEYFERASTLFEKIGDLDSATNVQYNVADSYLWGGQKERACTAYERSLATYRKNVAVSPGKKFSLPKGYSSFEDLIRDEKKRAECP